MEEPKRLSRPAYEEIQGLPNNTLKSLVKQYCQLSFVRLMDAGHAVSSYALETVYRIFQRAMLGNDVATDKTLDGPQYHTTGPTDSWGWRNTMPNQLSRTCMVEGKFQSINPWAATGLI